MQELLDRWTYQVTHEYHVWSDLFAVDSLPLLSPILGFVDPYLRLSQDYWESLVHFHTS